VGDADGVVVVPPPLMEQVIDLCKERADIDIRTFEALRAGTGMGDAIRQFRK
jgi:regulator of RNase E activity RraA